MSFGRFLSRRVASVFAPAICIAIAGFANENTHAQQAPPHAPRAASEQKSDFSSGLKRATPAQAKPAGTAPATESAAATAPSRPAKSADGRLTFSFRYQPWQEVLDWFAQQAGLSLLMESPPPGTFNYTDTRIYTPAEALDVLNGVLLTKGFCLVRHGRMLVVVNLEDGIPPNLVPDVPLAELDQHGEFELIRVLFPVWNMTPEQAATEVQPLLGPQGKVITLPQARQIQVTETGGRLRTIRSIVNSVEQPDQAKAGMREFPLRYVTFDAAMPTIRQMLGIPAEAFTTPDSSVQITKSAIGEKMLFRGTAQQAARLAEILRLIDVPEAARGINGAPQLEVYSVTTADAETVVKMLQTMLRDPSVVLTADKEAGHVMAFATPPQQATIRATIDQMQKDSRQVDVIGLSNVDPQVAVVAINKLFGTNDEKPDPKAPRVDADITTRSLLVRGTTGQVAQIRELLRKLGETDEAGAGAKSQQHVRLLPLSGTAARSAITQIEQIWPNVRANRIKVVVPSSTIPSYRPGEPPGNSPVQPAQPPTNSPQNKSADDLQQMWQSFLRERDTQPKQESQPAQDGAKSKDGKDSSTQHEATSIFRFAAEVQPGQSQSLPPKTAPATPQPTAQQPAQGQPATGRGAPIIIAPGPGGTLIASDDLEALDQLEDLLTNVAGHNAATGRDYRFFYLKFAKAQVVAEVLHAIFGGGSGGKDRGIIGDIANNALGDVGGGLMGDLLLGGGGGGSSFASGSVDIVPDVRLNALLVHAKLADLDTIEQLLVVLDQRAGPENIEAEAQARPIPVYNTTAAEIAQIVQQTYQDRMAGAGSVMSPQDMMKMIRGGNSVDQQVQKMSIAVDTRNNMLVVRAPDPLFEEVKALVQYLDQSNGDSPQTTRVYSLKNTNSSAVQKALVSLLGNVKTSTTPAQGPSTTQSAQSSNQGGGDDDSPEERMRRAMRRNWEMMQEMRRMQERSGGGGDGDRGGFDRSRFFGRGGDRGGGDRGRDGGSDRGGDRGRDGRR